MSAPLARPRPEDEQAARTQDDVARKIRELQNARRKIPLRVHLDGAAMPERTIFEAFGRLKITLAHAETSTDVASDPSDFWTIMLRIRDGRGETRVLGRMSSVSEGFAAFRRRHFEPLLSPTLAKGDRISLEVTETGSAAAYGPASVAILLEEVP